MPIIAKLAGETPSMKCQILTNGQECIYRAYKAFQTSSTFIIDNPRILNLSNEFKGLHTVAYCSTHAEIIEKIFLQALDNTIAQEMTGILTILGNPEKVQKEEKRLFLNIKNITISSTGKETLDDIYLGQLIQSRIKQLTQEPK